MNKIILSGIILLFLLITVALQTTYAASRGIGINFDFLSKGTQFVWRATLVQENASLGATVPTQLLVYHCSGSSGTAGEGRGGACLPGSGDYRTTITNESKSIANTASSATQQITHTSVDCGRIQIDLFDISASGNQPSTDFIFGGDTYDTGVACASSTATSTPPAGNPPTAPPQSQTSPGVATTRTPTSESTASHGIVDEVTDILFGRGTPLPTSGARTSPTATATPTPIPSQTPGGYEVNQSFMAMNELHRYVGQKVGVPACVLDAVSQIEWPTVYNFSGEEINKYSQPGQVMPNCPWNACSAAGDKQMTTGKDDRGSTSCSRCCWNGKCQTSCPNAWASNGTAVQEYDGATHTPNVCNLRDSAFAAAKKLKTDSGTAAGNVNWDWNAYYNAGYHYYGNCTVKYARLGNRTYCEYMAYQCSL